MDALTSLGNFFSGPSGKGLESLAALGTTGAGLVGNALNERQRAQQLSYLQAQEKAASDPTKLAAEVASATQPLNKGLTQMLTNQVSGTLAEQGLAESPGVLATQLTQAEAPFIQQNQQTALQLVMQKLGLPVSYASTLLAGLPPNVNLAPLLALLGRPSAGPGTTVTPSNIDALLKLYQSSQTPGITPTASQLPDWLTTPDSSVGDFTVPAETYA